MTDTEADLGFTQPSASPGVPVITVTGAGNVTLERDGHHGGGRVGDAGGWRWRAATTWASASRSR